MEIAPLPITTLCPLQLANEYIPMVVTELGMTRSQVILLLYLKAYSGMFVTLSPMVKVTMGVVPLLLVPLLKTEHDELVTIEVQFVALKCTVDIDGQFQKAYSPMEVTPVPMVNAELCAP